MSEDGVLTSPVKSSKKILPDFSSPIFESKKESIGEDILSYKEKSCIRFVYAKLDRDMESNILKKDKKKLRERRHQIMQAMTYYLKLVHKLGKNLKMVRMFDPDAERKTVKQRTLL